MTLIVFLITAIDSPRSFRMTFNVSLTTTANPLLMFRMTPNGNHMLRLLTHSSQLIADSFYLLTAFPQHKNRPIICMDRFFCWDQRVPVVLSRVSARWRASLARSTSISLLLDASLSSARFFAAWARAISMVSASSAKGATIFT